MVALKQEFDKNEAGLDQVLITQRKGIKAVEDYLKQKGVSDYDLNETLKWSTSGAITDFRGSVIIDDDLKTTIFQFIDQIAKQKARSSGSGSGNSTPPGSPLPGQQPPPQQNPPSNSPPNNNSQLPNQSPPGNTPPQPSNENPSNNNPGNQENNTDITETKAKAKQQINRELTAKKLKKTDLNSKYRDWENEVDKLNNKDKIWSFVLKVIAEINR